MRNVVIALALLPSLATDAAPLHRLRTDDSLRIVFLDADERSPVHQGATGDATLDVGTVRAERCARHCMRTIVKRRFRVRIDGGAGTARFVRLRAYVQDAQPGQRVLVDGRALTSAPLLIDAAAPLHVAVAHTLEIEVATSAPEGAIANTVSWLIEDAP